MGRKARVLIDEKFKAIEDYLSGERGVIQICLESKVDKRSFYDWLRKYQMQGKQGLQALSYNKYYPEEIKLKAVKDYNKGLGSLNQICDKYDVLSHSILRQWIKKYNGHETFKSQNAQGVKYMGKARKTTYEGRTEIVAFCVANNNNYQLTSKQFQVSYQQVYSWVKKYKVQGYETLIDRRGKHKNPEELNESEKFAVQLKLIGAENKLLKMENDFLKKLDEVKRRRYTAEHTKNTDI